MRDNSNDLNTADRCVMCGMCLPHCPTYQATADETDSPRGRLSLMLGMTNGQLNVDTSVQKHLNSCTGCGACEAMCPSGVPYMALIDSGRQLVVQKHRPGRVLRVLLYAVKSVKHYRNISLALKNRWIYRIIQFIGLSKSIEEDLYNYSSQHLDNRPFDTLYRGQVPIQGDVALFTGCIGSQLDKTTLLDSIRLLTACGYNVHVPTDQVCCGALHQHNGYPQQAQHLLENNQQCFDNEDVDAIIVSASGCATQLQQLDNDSPPVYDIVQFIHEKQLLKRLQLQSTKQNVVVHEACSLRYQLKQTVALYNLLDQIPGLEYRQLDGNAFCCGAGGSTFIIEPDMARRLRQPKIDALQQLPADILLTTNIGCALHLGSGLLSQHKQPDILHPVSLLVRCSSLQ